ncbi:hypothetical protein AC1031_006634 [Aphanomyces cochlioides]|nr:hypothetical protein AC1031_006634 [Aphanomyces cochlioides]
MAGDQGVLDAKESLQDDDSDANDDDLEESILEADPKTDETYDKCFEVDWAASQVDKTVKDAAECRRIQELLKPHYRILVHLFRAYATSSSANVGCVLGQMTNNESRSPFDFQTRPSCSTN